MKEPVFSTRYIKNHTLILFILGLIISCLLGWMMYKNNINRYIDNIIHEQQRDIIQSQLIFSHKIGNMRSTIQLLHDDLSLLQALNSAVLLNKSLAQELFVSFIHNFDSLMQVRWLDSEGREQVRVDGRKGEAFIIPEQALQDKRDRYYFTEGINAPEKKVYLSALDLNIENGEVEIPYRPTIRVTLRTNSSDNLKSGLLVLNYDMGMVLNSLREFNNNHIQLQVIDQHGYWIMHPEHRYEWGYDLGNDQNNVQVINPEIWAHFQNNREQTGIEDKIGLLSYQCSDLTEGYAHTDFSQNAVLCFMSVTPQNIISKQKWITAIPGILVSIIIFLSGGWVLVQERKNGIALIRLNKRLARDKALIEESAEQTRKLLKQQQILQDDLVESRKLSALGMMVAGVAHELNTPLGASIMASSTMRKELNRLVESYDTGLTKEDLQHYLASAELGLDLVENNQQRAAELVRSFKRLAIDRAREEIVPFNLKQVLNDLIKTLHHRLKSARIETDVQIDNIEMLGIPGIISQVIQNLVMNAIHHAFEPDSGGKLTVSATSEQEWVILKVSDNGRGIVPELIPKLFDPFVTSKRSQGNTGLGMHFVHQWVTLSLNGTIAVETEQDKGTTFEIRIPKEIKITLPDD